MAADAAGRPWTAPAWTAVVVSMVWTAAGAIATAHVDKEEKKKKKEKRTK